MMILMKMLFTAFGSADVSQVVITILVIIITSS
jgi:hypothetical protein